MRRGRALTGDSMEDKELRLAVLIDAENISIKYVKCIFDEVSNYGVATYKRAYGDWTSSRLNGWKEVFLKSAITPVQQYSYTQGKNSTDSAMIIDAMDILYSGKVDGFCIISSDSDFTRLSARLREAGMFVIGMGEKKTVEAFRASCSLFKYLEVLASEDAEEDAEDVTSKQDLEEEICKIIMDNNSIGKETTVGEIGSKICNRHADFDVRNYGYSKLSRFLESFKTVKLTHGTDAIFVELKRSGLNREQIVDYVNTLLDSKKGKMPLPTVKQMIEKKYPGFNIRDFEYSKFSRFINDIDGITVIDNEVVKK